MFLNVKLRYLANIVIQLTLDISAMSF